MTSTDQEVRQRFLDRTGKHHDDQSAIHLLSIEQDEELILMLAACTGRARRLVIKVLTNRGYKWRSVARWPYPDVSLGNTDNESDDTHDGYLEAENVCLRLRLEGLGGEGKIFPLETRIEPVSP